MSGALSPMECSLTGSSASCSQMEEDYCCSVAQSCLTFCHPWTEACQASQSFTVSWSLLKLKSFESMVLSNHLILCERMEGGYLCARAGLHLPAVYLLKGSDMDKVRKFLFESLDNVKIPPDLFPSSICSRDSLARFEAERGKLKKLLI